VDVNPFMKEKKHCLYKYLKIILEESLKIGPCIWKDWAVVLEEKLIEKICLNQNL
jgi:hypothetical protein